MDRPMEKAIYIAPEHPTFSFKRTIAGKKEIIQFVRGELHTDDETLIEFIDGLIATRPQFSSIMRKVDREAAIAVAKKYQADHPSGSMTGTMSSANASQQVRQQLEARDAVLDGMDPAEKRKMTEQIAKDNLQMTETVNVVEQPSEPVPDMPEKTEIASPKKAFAALAGK